MLLVSMLILTGRTLQPDIVSDVDGYKKQIGDAQGMVKQLKEQLAKVSKDLRNKQVPDLKGYKQQKDEYQKQVNDAKSKVTAAKNKAAQVPVVGLAVFNAAMGPINDLFTHLDQMFASLETLISRPIGDLSKIADDLDGQQPLMDEIIVDLGTTMDEMDKVKSVLAPPPPPPTPPAPSPSW